MASEWKEKMMFFVVTICDHLSKLKFPAVLC